MTDKYRIHDVAKDLNVSSKEIIELLAKKFEEPKNHSKVLENNELNFIFEHYTKVKEVENFEEYFAMVENKNEPKELEVSKPQPKKDQGMDFGM